MDPTVIAAIISAAASMGTSIFERWSGKATKVDERLDQLVKGQYEKLRRFLTDPCVKILKRAEDGQNHDMSELRDLVYPNLTFSTVQQEMILDEEFSYRLRYLQLIGALTQAGNDYYITRIGMAFLREARERKDYFKILFS